MAYVKTVWVNGTAPALNDSNLNKIEQGIFDSLAQDGTTAMTGQLVTTAGSAATPAIAPTGDANTGIFFPAADTIAFAEGGTEAMRITSAGSVGIGTTSPLSLLHIKSSTSADLTIFESTDDSATGAPDVALFRNSATPAVSDFVGNLIFRGNNSSLSQANYAQIIGQIQDPTATSEDGNLLFYTFTNGATTEKMRITSAGNVGIGTTSPNDKLEVSGGIRRTLTVNGSNASPASEVGLQYQYDNTTSRTGIYFHNTYNNNGRAWMSFWITDASNVFKQAMVIDGFSENVGIGTTSPTNKLQIDGVTANTSCINAVANTTTGQSFGIALSAGTNSSDYALNIRNAAQTTQLFHITGAGNVGIGTTSPSQKFEVSGGSAKIYGTAGGAWLFIASPDATSGMQFGMNSTEDGNIFHNENKNIIFGTNNISRFILESGGTTRPSANNTYDLGSATYRWATIYAQNALNTSDARLKTNVEPSSLGLDFIASLNPVQYKWIEGGNSVEKVQTGTEIVEITPAIPAQPEQAEILDEEGNVIQAYVPATEEVAAVTEERPIYEEVITPREGVRTHFGLIAQEVKAALPDGLDFAGWCLADKDDADSTQSLGYMQLIAPMIKAIQELKAEIDTLKAQLAQQ